MAQKSSASHATSFVSTVKEAPSFMDSPPSTSYIPNRSHKAHKFNHSEIDLDHYFVGPRDINHHSKLPNFMRLHGSVLPKITLSLIFIGCWATAITCISKFAYKLSVNSVLLTITGFVVGLALSFRSSTAYERYAEGRKYWSQLMLSSRNLARHIWIHTSERHDNAEDPSLGKADLLGKLTALNLINAYAIALKHRLRFEPSTDYPDLQPLVDNIETMAGRADKQALHQRQIPTWKSTAQYLGVTFAMSNPRKTIKNSKDNLGNLPLEILSYLSAYIDSVIANGTMPVPANQSNAHANVIALGDVLTGVERVLNTPLPVAYSISISQITWVYVLLLPFQLYEALGWITIPGTLFAAYIILGIAAIGDEIENPFGNDVNDLPLDSYCRELAADIDVLTSIPAPKPEVFITSARNKVLYPLSQLGFDAWNARSVDEIREALKAKATTAAGEVGLRRVKTMLASSSLADGSDVGTLVNNSRQEV